jgi:hypothetical protein
MSSKRRCETLIDETLSCSRMSPIVPDGCLVVNAAGKELQQCGVEGLSAIEQTIRNRVSRDSEGCADHNELLQKHPGLLNLWGAYFAIGEAEHTARMVQFLRSLDGPVLATALLTMTSTWLYRKANPALPGPVLDLVREIAETRTGNAAEIAKNLLVPEEPQPH